MRRQARYLATGASVRDAHDRVLRAIDDLERKVAANHSLEQAEHLRRTRWKAIPAVVVLLGGTVGSLGIMATATKQLPTPVAPGVIGVATLEEGSEHAAMDVRASFYASADRGTAFTLAVSDWEGGLDDSLSVVLYFCGPVREGLELTEMNTEEHAVLESFGSSNAIESDSVFGPRSDCAYTVVRGYGRQVLVSGVSTHESTTVSGAHIAYSFPGVRTPVVKESLGQYTAWPLSKASTVGAAVVGAPWDLTIESARPHIPDSGRLSWTYPSSANATNPREFLVSGALDRQEAVAQVQLFVAGALAGLAGAALIWTTELALDLSWRRDRQRTRD